jgi:threonine dehydrogenase-like Zn-dependent dehydrogenase
MRALWLEDGRLSVRDSDAPRAAPGEALVRVRRVGVCGTDLALLAGYLPFAGVPGHEFVGEVLDAPDAPSWAGQRVVADINVACGTCDACRCGRRSHCARRHVLGLRGRPGACAELLSVPVANLRAVPGGLSDDAAVFAEPLAAALHVLDDVEAGVDTRALVIGGGRLGTLIALALRLGGCEPFVVVRDEGRAARLRGLGLAAGPFDARPAELADVVVECSGRPEGFALARRAVRARGTLVLKSTYREAVTVDLSGLVVDEVRLLGSRCGDLGRALGVLERGALDPRPLIDARYPLERAPEAFARAAEVGVMKVLIEV